MTADVDLFDLYRRATRSVFRLEVRPHYAVPAESAQFQAFQHGQPLPHDPQVERSMQLIRAATAAGTRIHRVHVLDQPLTSYLRYELTAYAENAAAGEEVRVADRSWHNDLTALTEDFVLFDADTEHPAIVWMRYHEQGHVTRREYSDNPTDVARGRRDREVAMNHSVPLDEFAAVTGVG